MNYTSIIGIALWALIPGFVAKKKGRSFWGYYFLSFLITPLITMIITFCLSDLNKLMMYTQEVGTDSIGYLETNAISSSQHIDVGINIIDEESPGENIDLQNRTKEQPIYFCRKCGIKLIENSNFCSECGCKISLN